MAKVPLNRRVNAYGQHYPQQPQTGEKYEDLHEGYIHPSQITKNGGAILNFVKSLKQEIGIKLEVIPKTIHMQKN